MTRPDELLEPFVAAVATTLREMAGVEAVERDRFWTPGGPGRGDVTAILPLAGASAGWLAVALPAATATAIARRVLAETGVEPDDIMVRDCAGELANVIAGQAKTLAFGTPHHFTLATPTVASGAAIPTGGGWAIAFASDIGEFDLVVRLPGYEGDGERGR